LLTAQQVMTMLSMDRTTFYRLAATEPNFPKPVVVGRDKKGREVKRYKKWLVLLYLETLR
jgi:hypothetical protein